MATPIKYQDYNQMQSPQLKQGPLSYNDSDTNDNFQKQYLTAIAKIKEDEEKHNKKVKGLELQLKRSQTVVGQKEEQIKQLRSKNKLQDDEIVKLTEQNKLYEIVLFDDQQPKNNKDFWDLQFKFEALKIKYFNIEKTIIELNLKLEQKNQEFSEFEIHQQNELQFIKQKYDEEIFKANQIIENYKLNEILSKDEVLNIQNQSKILQVENEKFNKRSQIKLYQQQEI